MSIHLPGSVLSRALRSRLIQQRLINTHPYRLNRPAALVGSRLYSTADSAPDETVPNQDNETPVWRLPRERGLSWRKASAASSPGNDREREAEGRMLMAIASGSSGSRGGASISPKKIEMEVKWLADPLALAYRVERLLQAGDPAMAAALVRQAQKNGQGCEVAWNNLMRYCMIRGHPNAAFKFYNDMKKRGRMPNAKTYTIMLKGYSTVPKAPGIVETAHLIYRSISAKNSTVPLDIIHTNAMLSVCQRHGDMDMLWRIAGDLPEEGPGAPNMITYSIILGALEYTAREDVQRMDVSEVDTIIERKDQLVKEGKRIWADILYRWTKEQVPIDSHVVNSMAALLLEGAKDRDFYDVFALYHQTMDIPIFPKVPPENLKAARRVVAIQKMLQDPSQDVEDVPFVDENNKVIRNREEPLPDIDEEGNFDSLFNPVVRETEGLLYVQPDNKALSNILHACMMMTQGAPTGTLYWNHLTRESTAYRIKPDNQSFNQYLRLLRISRSSKLVVRLVREQMLPSGHVTGKALHIALACCRRDRRNPKVLAHANELLDSMYQALVIPEPRVLQGYLYLIQALSNDPHYLLRLEDLDTKDTKPKRRSGARQLETLGKQLQAQLHVRAVKALRPHFYRLHEAMEHGKPAPKTRWSSVTDGDERVSGEMSVKTMAWIRTMIDETLKSIYSPYVDKNERNLLMSDSNLLKTYSDKGTIEKFAKRIVYPTIEQRNEYKERRSGFIDENEVPNGSSDDQTSDLTELLFVEGNPPQSNVDLPEA